MDLTKIMPTKVDPSLKGKNFLFYGEPGTRKTTIASKFPKPIFAQTEDGTKFIDGVYAAQVNNWNDALLFRRQLQRKEIKEMFLTVVFDRIDTLYGYCYDYVLKRLDIDSPASLGFGQAWTAIKKEWKKFLDSIESEGYGMVFICHDKDVLDNKMRVIGTKIQIENTAATEIRGLTDFIFNLKREDDTVIAYANLANVETKSRAPYFADSFEFTFENLEKELATAVEKEQKMDGITLEARARKQNDKRDFEELRATVIKKITNLMEIKSPHMTEVGQVIQTQIPDFKISEAPEMYYDNMLVIETYLLSLEG